MSAEGDEAERLQVLEQYRKKVRVWRAAMSMHKKCDLSRRLFLFCPSRIMIRMMAVLVLYLVLSKKPSAVEPCLVLLSCMLLCWYLVLPAALPTRLISLASCSLVQQQYDSC